VFTPGDKETAYDPSARVAGAQFLHLSEAVELSALTNVVVVDVSDYRRLCRCSVLVLHKAQGEGCIW
jgi:hypothetical protein